jgi:PAS domain S-box-containing protein
MNTSAKTILLVEDETLIALAETRKLEQAGYKVIHSLTGESAIDIVDESPAAVDLILMDIDLGKGMDGTETAQEILKNHNIPVLFLSSHTEPEIVKKTEEITNYGYVVKSSSFTVLDASMKMAFKLFRAMKQLDLDSMEIESTNEELRKSLAKLQNAYDSLELRETMQEKLFRLSPDAICITRLADGVCKDVNQSFSRLFGFTREEAVGRSCFSGDLNIWIRQEEREKLAIKLREDRDPISFEMDFRCKDGSVIMTSTSADLISIGGEDCIISSMRDISADKRSERELRESEERYRILFEEAGAGILVYDLDLRILDANKKSIKMFDYSKEELLALSMRQLDPDLSDPDKLSTLTEGILESGPYTFMSKKRSKDGMVLPVEVNAMSIVWRGKPAVMAVVHDVAEEIEIKRKYAVSQTITRAILENRNEILLVGIDNEFKCLYLNKSYHDLKADKFGLGIQIGDCLMDNLPEDTLLASSLPHYRRALSGESTRIIEEYDQLGMAFDTIFNPIRGNGGEVLGVAVFSIDVTERMALEKRLREKESQLRTIGDNTPAFLAILDANSTRYQYVNRMYESSLGLTKDQILGKTIKDIAGDANYQNAAKYLDEALQGHRTSYERRFSLAQGPVWAHMDYIPQLDDKGKVERILILGVDITNLKNAAEALEKSEERFRLAMEATKDAIWDIDIGNDQVYFNPAYFAMFGYGQEDASFISTWPVYFHSDEITELSPLIADCIENRRQEFDVDYRAILKDGSSRWLNICGKVVERDANQRAKRLLGTIRDISERKDAEAELREQKSQLEAIADNIPAALVLLDASSLRYQYVNQKYAQSLGLAKDRIVGKNLWDVIEAENYQEASKHLAIAMNGHRVTRVRQFALAKGEIWAQIDYIPQFDEDGKVKRIVFLIVDITTLRDTTEALRKSEERFRLAMDAANEGIWDYNLPADEIYFSPAYYQIFGHSDEEIGGPLGFAKYVHPDDCFRSLSAMHDCIENRKEDIDFDYRMQAKDGTWKWIYTHGRAVKRDSSGKATRMIGTSRDITDRKLSEERIRQLLREKELILREVHHRIKNNLQVMASILSIRVADSEDARMNMILNEAISEIKSMSLLYDKLYRTEYIGTMPVREYLPELLSQASQVFGGGLPLDIETEIEDIDLDAGKLSRLGIVVNELLTNSLKYAFDGVVDPTITLRVFRQGARVHIEYEDNGLGLPESFSMQSTEGFGMQLIKAMMDQIGGTMNAEIRKGARFTIDFDA